MEKLNTIITIAQKILELINDDLIKLFSKKNVDQLIDIHINYTAMFLAFNNMSILSVKKQHQKFHEYLTIFINGLKFFNRIFNYQEFLDKLEILLKTIDKKEISETESAEEIRIGGFGDNDFKYIPCGFRHATWLDKLKAKYNLGENILSLYCDLFHDQHNNCEKFMQNEFDKITKFSPKEHIEYWSKLAHITEPLELQIEESEPILKNLKHVINFRKELPSDIFQLVNFIEKAIQEIRKQDHKMILDDKYEISDFNDEYKKLISRKNALLERHKLLENIKQKINFIKTSNMPNSKINFVLSKPNTEPELIKQIIKINESLAGYLLEQEKYYGLLANKYGYLIQDLRKLLEDKLFCSGNPLLLARFIRQLLSSDYPNKEELLKKIMNEFNLQNIDNINDVLEKIC